MAVANATAAIVQREPAYVTYRVRGTFHVAGDGTVDKTVTVRTNDGLALVHDVALNKDTLRPPFPASPSFDALSQFELMSEWMIDPRPGHHEQKRDTDMSITNVHPLHYEATASHADAVARAIKGYVVTFAPDATPALGHLHFERNAVMHDDKWLRDVWYDPATLIPSRVVWGGGNDLVLDARYAMVQGHWLLQSIRSALVVHAPLWLGRMSLALDGTYSDYTFADVAPDPRLAPAAPTPAR